MSRLNYHHLHYFWRVATLGNLTEAARQLHVSQSALSAQIRALEESMDTQLFERSGRRLRLTATGQRVLGYANDIFSRGEELESLLRHGIEPEYQQLRIGVLSTMSRNFIEGFIAPLINQPKVRFSLHARGMDNLLNGLATHQFDLILTNSNVAAEGQDSLWQSQLLARQPLAVVGPPEQKPEAEFPQGMRASAGCYRPAVPNCAVPLMASAAAGITNRTCRQKPTIWRCCVCWRATPAR